jgi:hypothetical protein
MDEFEDGLAPDDAYEQPAQSSIAAPLIRALLAAAVAFGVYALVFGGLFADDDLDISADLVLTPTPVPLPTVTQPPLDTLPTPTPTPTADIGGEVGQVGAGVTAQVIAGAQTTRDQFDDAVRVLRELGYDVSESTSVSPNRYEVTTIFATAGHEAQAEALRDADPRFTTIGDNPGTLTDQIQIHILVGEDWPTGAAADDEG